MSEAPSSSTSHATLAHARLCARLVERVERDPVGGREPDLARRVGEAAGAIGEVEDVAAKDRAAAVVVVVLAHEEIEIAIAIGVEEGRARGRVDVVRVAQRAARGSEHEGAVALVQEELARLAGRDRVAGRREAGVDVEIPVAVDVAEREDVHRPPAGAAVAARDEARRSRDVLEARAADVAEEPRVARAREVVGGGRAAPHDEIGPAVAVEVHGGEAHALHPVEAPRARALGERARPGGPPIASAADRGRQLCAALLRRHACLGRAAERARGVAAVTVAVCGRAHAAGRARDARAIEGRRRGASEERKREQEEPSVHRRDHTAMRARDARGGARLVESRRAASEAERSRARSPARRSDASRRADAPGPAHARGRARRPLRSPWLLADPWTEQRVLPSASCAAPTSRSTLRSLCSSSHARRLRPRW